MVNAKRIINLTLAIPLVLAALAAVVVATSAVSYADGQGSPAQCLGKEGSVLGSQEGTDDEVTVKAPDGKVVTGVCIKSGENMFGGNQHSGVLGNGTFENNCYRVVGVGTQEVTVTRIGSGSNCQEISHIDVVVGQPDEDEEEPNTPRDEDGEVLGDQVDAPAGGVSAGMGSTGLVAGSIAGLGGSIAAAGYGVRRLLKKN